MSKYNLQYSWVVQTSTVRNLNTRNKRPFGIGLIISKPLGRYTFSFCSFINGSSFLIAYVIIIIMIIFKILFELDLISYF